MSKRYRNQQIKQQSKQYMNKQGRSHKGTNREKPHNYDKVPQSKEEAMLDAEGRNNNPNWYFLDAKVAEQVSQCSFRTIAGYPMYATLPNGTSDGSGIGSHSQDMALTSICAVWLNPSPGVQRTYNTVDSQQSAINLAGFRLFQKISAFTGRKIETYGPQDLSTLILYFGEIISLVEWGRRVFGVFYTSSERNRAYPRAVLQAMRVNPDDFAANYPAYRTRFNALVTRLNAVVIPKNINYFDKCASLYEKIYLDSESPMAQTIFYSPNTTWNLDETSYEGGTRLVTATFMDNATGTGASTPVVFGTGFLSKIESMVDTLLNSATFNSIFMDLLNLASKQSMEFWKFDYLLDGYTVMPEYNRNFLLQFHNMTFIGTPSAPALTTTGTGAVTPNNDVYPNPDDNALFYNPGWIIYSNLPTTAPTHDAIIDSDVAAPGTEDRIEMMRFTAMSGKTIALNISGSNYSIDAVLPDHYAVAMLIQTANGTRVKINHSYNNDDWRAAALLSQIDWAPFQYVLETESGSVLRYSGNVVGDLNYYTTIDAEYLQQVADFVGFALYDVR